MPYIYAILFALGFASGFGISHQVDKAEIVRMEDAIIAQKAEAHAILSSVQERIAAAQAKAKEANINLDKAHDQDIKTINAYRDALATARLHDPGRRPGGGSALSAGTDTGISQTETGTGELSAELTRFLQIKFYAADKVAEYANQCYAFVVEQNCGIQGIQAVSSPDKLLSEAY